ncbi:hypothetical protein COCOBI_02-7340 [Coccomyxa sp. Obi]|nr:hypothetical protein COCOBI_02-7340 [Coccomyxa sp. Obi]
MAADLFEPAGRAGRRVVAESWSGRIGAGWREVSEPGPPGQFSEDTISESSTKKTLKNASESMLRLWQLQHVPAMPQSSACFSNSTGVEECPLQQPAPLYADSVRRKRKHKMNKHKHRKRLKKLRHRTK